VVPVGNFATRLTFAIPCATDNSPCGDIEQFVVFVVNESANSHSTGFSEPPVTILRASLIIGNDI
jgi:hypothetical protein